MPQPPIRDSCLAMPLPIETDRLTLRRREPHDADALHALFSDPEVMRWLPAEVSTSLDETRLRMQRRDELEKRHGYGLWTVVEKESGNIVGCCGLWPVEDKGPEIEIAYHLTRAYWGKGYITEAAAAVVDYGLGELGLDRIIAIADPENFRSRRVMEKIGMRFEGRARYYGSQMVVYSIGPDDAA